MLPTDGWNATYNSGTVMTNAVSGGTLLFLLLLVAGSVGLVLLITSIERYTQFWVALEWLWKSVKYTIYGAGITVAGFVLYTVCTILAFAGSGISLQHIALAISAYVGVTVLGWGATRIYNRLKNIHETYKTSRVQQI